MFETYLRGKREGVLADLMARLVTVLGRTGYRRKTTLAATDLMNLD